MLQNDTSQTRLLAGTFAGALLLAAQSPAMASNIVSYEMSGYFGTPGTLELEDAYSGDPVTDAELLFDPFDYMFSFNLSFDLDPHVSGYVPIFSPSAFFDDAVSNMSLNVDGNPYWSADGTTYVAQTSPIYDQTAPEIWSWSDFGSTFTNPDELTVIDQFGFELTTLVPDGVGIHLADATRTLYDGQSLTDMLIFDGSEFTDMLMILSWEVPELYDPWGDPINDYYGYYELEGTIENVRVSAVPVPAAAWLFGSGLLALIGMGRKSRRA